MSRREREELFKSEIEKEKILETLKVYPPYHFLDESDPDGMTVLIKKFDENEDINKNYIIIMKVYGYGYPFATNTFYRPFEVFSKNDAVKLIDELSDYYRKIRSEKLKDDYIFVIIFDGNMAYLLRYNC